VVGLESKQTAVMSLFRTATSATALNHGDPSSCLLLLLLLLLRGV